MEPGQAALLKRRAATASLVTNCTLASLKLVAAALTGSVSLFSEAAHSATDVVTSLLTYASVRFGAAPPDEEHNYGHGKVESLAGFGESVLLMGIVAFVVIESVPRLWHPRAIGFASVGLVVMAVSALASIFVGTFLTSVGRRTDSIALKTNGQHLKIDFWTSAGVLAALALNRFANLPQADPIVALILAAWIARNAWQMAREAFDQLIDRRISDEDLKVIEHAIGEDPRILSYHKLRTRHSGAQHCVELHVVVPSEWSLLEAHEVADRLEKKIESSLAPATVVIHMDPFDPGKAT